jgi:hypothetical protein
MWDWVNKMGDKAKYRVHVPADVTKAYNKAVKQRDDKDSTSGQRVDALKAVAAWNKVLPPAHKK